MPRLYTPKPDPAVHARKQLICSRGCWCLWWCWRWWWWWWWWWWFQDGSKRSKLRGSKRSKSRGSKRPRDPTYVHIYILYLHWDNSNLWLHLSRRKDLNRAMSESQWISLSLKCYGFSHITKHTTPSVRFTALMGCFLMMFAEKKALPSAQHAKHLYRLACSAWAQMSKRRQFKWMIVTCT